MTYTLFMPADQGIRIAEDGTAEVSMTEARANLTRLIRAVREDGRTAAFTERGERRAYVISPEEEQRSTVRTGLLLLAAEHFKELPEGEREPWMNKLIHVADDF